MVIHDPRVDKTSNGTGIKIFHLEVQVEGFVYEMTTAELQTLDAAYHWKDFKGKGIKIPTFQQVLHIECSLFHMTLKAIEWLEKHPEILLIIEPKTNATKKTAELIRLVCSKGICCGSYFRHFKSILSCMIVLLSYLLSHGLYIE